MMNKRAIVTTSINPPTEAIRKFCEIARRDGWLFYVIGDLKTPDDAYAELREKYYDVLLYVSPSYQAEHFPKLSELIGWNCIQRRNIGFVMAYKMGAEVIATIDDDNIPKDNWGKNLSVGQRVYTEIYEPQEVVFDPLSVTNHRELWHRGYPVQLLETKNKVERIGDQMRKVLVQADLWDGNPDIDAICRIGFNPKNIYFDTINPFGSNKIAPFNSQNTFLSRECFPHYFLPPGIGRMDDIWASYWLQHLHPDSLIFMPASVFQDRNEHDLVKDLEQEMIGYKNTLELVNNISLYPSFLPSQALEAYDEYKRILIVDK